MEQYNMRFPDRVMKALDQYVDGVRYRSKAQLITVILSDWLEHPYFIKPKKRKVEKCRLQK